MMMFTRLKNQSIETILLLATFNLVAVGLIAIKAARVSPEILGFSIVAAFAAGTAIAILAFKLADPLNRLAQQASEWNRPDTEADLADRERTDTIGTLARGISGLKEAIQDNEADHSAARGVLDEAMRRLSNGDATTLVQQPFPEAMEGLRVRFNRLASMLNLNLSVISRATQGMREQARSSQADLTVIGDRLVNARPAMQKALSAIEVMQRATRLRGEDARLVSRSTAEGQQASWRLGRAAGEAHDAAAAATSTFGDLSQLIERVGDLAIRAESLASASEQRLRAPSASSHPTAAHGRPTVQPIPADALRQLAADCTEAARSLMLQYRQVDSHLADTQHALSRVLRETDCVGQALTEMAEPAERLSHNVDLEHQRLTLAHETVGETAVVLERSREIVASTEACLVKVAGDVAIIDTRLSLFAFTQQDEPVRRERGLKPTLRSVT
ncbi:hypothetical protein SAMN05880590_102371 [Rhizobium sp. RU35A]|uniref:hypothetical protein n=1 Tax=Rhizobium sp. RU35A TaxID=1907414 RepID=UPI000956527F|nr:hypothetical protein [Rhizobium sp. RU35A]SIQ16656.1 hypothetical protein SAMN05880590_102371 [Rhizobium sp. RU35A]